MAQDPTFPLVPIANFLACIIVLLSLSKSMFQSWNVGVCSFAIWMVATSLIKAVDSIIWAGNVENVAPVWCDIIIHFQIGSNVSIPAATFVMVRRLSILIRQHDPVSEKRNIRSLLADLSLCVGIPVAIMALSYVVQASRFAIIEEYGCTSALADVGLGILLVGSIPIVFPLLSLLLYSPSLVWIYIRHRRVDELLASGAPLDRQSFIKVLALGLLDVLITFPITVYNLVTPFIQNEKIISFWPGWKAVHADMSSVPTITSDEWKSSGEGLTINIRFSQWTNPLFAMIFFILFGLTERKKLFYRNVFWTLLKPFGFAQSQEPIASEIVFDSGAMIGSDVNQVLATDTIDPSVTVGTAGRRKSFENAAESEERQSNSFESQSLHVSEITADDA